MDYVWKSIKFRGHFIKIRPSAILAIIHNENKKKILT